MMQRLMMSVILAMTAAAGPAQASIEVQVAGEVAHSGQLEFVGAPRLADAVKAAEVKRGAYVLGAAWLRPSLQSQQTRLKAGLTYELGVIREQSLADGKESLAALAQALRTWIGQMPVTGRQVVRTLEPHALQVSGADNLPLANGDQLVYPSRPNSVAVVGAVRQRCDLPQVGLQDARDYLAHCEPSAFADPDTIYVIEPDGNVFEQGVALWNRSPPIPVAPGAVLYVPLARNATAHAVDAGFNHEMAEFIASQVSGSTGMNP